jgi:hypothetical protein
MGTCDQCKWWGRYRGGQCDRVDRFGDEPGRTFEIWFSALDDSGLQLGLETGPKFGCILFEAKRNRK